METLEDKIKQQGKAVRNTVIGLGVLAASFALEPGTAANLLSMGGGLVAGWNTKDAIKYFYHSIRRYCRPSEYYG